MNKLVMLLVLVCLLGMGVQSMNIPGAELAEQSDKPLTLNLTSRGFGCNGPWDKNEYTCNAHCKSNKFKGGYCNALLGWYRCDCYN